MPIDTRELMEAIAIVADEQNIRVAVKQSAKGTAICAACCFAGGLLMGPVGLAVGGAAGGIAAYKVTCGECVDHDSCCTLLIGFVNRHI